MKHSILFSRRAALRVLPVGIPALWTPGVMAEQLEITPRLTEGPFYPDKLPLDTDNDLLVINDSIDPAVGQVTHLTGKVLRRSGEPVRNAFVEIWQVDANGVYLHSGSNGAKGRDTNFQGYGRFLTDVNGRYYFRTIKPTTYPGRTPHIHFAVSMNGHRVMTSQILIEGHPQNERDGVFRTIRDVERRKLVTAKFNPIADSKLNELQARFNIVMGETPQEDDQGVMRGGIGPSDRASRRRG
ncbi:dioxygenase family protein [Crateriforma conspicua]|uniref:Protocatechuate 3,4-dioxygenase beta chain n=1 Tax=Crateriforma conspicua TaxID=2527996 RepID=A0A5C5YBV9_9PLAN|nr:protocatechuate 3,4-dioxygenase [Crateriforma conspicua]QDV61480.1 Protocatechuate 3,4-dioxygenase beta chain [Crateriforma conspicua]TWT72273.1 Protocatechuate 3,4-dioxygenase beta chain [Crateriforma conspicua]